MTDEISLEGKCAKCAYWCGSKKESNKMFLENPLSMHLTKGWPNSGECKISYEFLNFNIDGDAIVEVEFDANFGCAYFDED